jgi:hypothetical protein
LDKLLEEETIQAFDKCSQGASEDANTFFDRFELAVEAKRIFEPVSILEEKQIFIRRIRPAMHRQLKLLYKNRAVRTAPTMFELLDDISAFEESQGIKAKKVNSALEEKDEYPVSAAVKLSYPDRNRRKKRNHSPPKNPNQRNSENGGLEPKSSGSGSGSHVIRSNPPSCWVCEAMGHWKSDCPVIREVKQNLKNKKPAAAVNSVKDFSSYTTSSSIKLPF